MSCVMILDLDIFILDDFLLVVDVKMEYVIIENFKMNC